MQVILERAGGTDSWKQRDAGGRKQTGRKRQGEQRVAPGSAPLS
ncbi:hypothetical protein [Blautia producta]|nr:hypothetical protein [Blautia producta]